MSDSTLTDKKKLRITTYMCPDYPEGLYQVYKEFFEHCLGVECELNIINSHAHDESPFAKDIADIVFMSLVSYVKILQQQQHDGPVLCDALPVAPIFDLIRHRDDPRSYSEIIILSSKKDHVKSFDDLRGHRWSVVNDRSLVLYELSKMGHYSSFFSFIIHTNNEREAIRSVLEHSSDATSVDAAILKSYLDQYPDYANKLHILKSWGPYPPEPIVLSNNLSSEIKTKLVSSLMNIKQHHPEFASKFRKHNVTGFDCIDVHKFQEMAESLRNAERMKMRPVYY
ncbi:hypothetical protein HELRODRAFT_186052 [Helobdella robusta]|uniref:Uncharacterized protein n=1 Tax=Helobdella robusta TaxID=6412 RepID=T1FNL7_HELRO|nr:hypothetical protein HELRODRAFT_186052 [Helobdella robusta]ESN93821.1 hypothetical protein HELRODRAFT_186052 [Helobdella robusta]